jgi:uncharacterized protein
VSQSLTYPETGTAARSQVRALFAQAMGYVAVTAALIALGAWLGRGLSGGAGIVAFIAAFAALIGMRFAAKRSTELTVALLAVFGLLMGVAVAPVIAVYASVDPRALWDAGAATALFIAGFGAAGYAARRDLTALARVLFWALLGHRLRPAARRVHLPGHRERLPVLPGDLHRRARIILLWPPALRA